MTATEKFLYLWSSEQHASAQPQPPPPPPATAYQDLSPHRLLKIKNDESAKQIWSKNRELSPSNRTYHQSRHDESAKQIPIKNRDLSPYNDPRHHRESSPRRTYHQEIKPFPQTESDDRQRNLSPSRINKQRDSLPMRRDTSPRTGSRTQQWRDISPPRIHQWANGHVSSSASSVKQSWGCYTSYFLGTAAFWSFLLMSLLLFLLSFTPSNYGRR